MIRQSQQVGFLCRKSTEIKSFSIFLVVLWMAISDFRLVGQPPYFGPDWRLGRGDGDGGMIWLTEQDSGGQMQVVREWRKGSVTALSGCLIASLRSLFLILILCFFLCSLSCSFFLQRTICCSERKSKRDWNCSLGLQNIYLKNRKPQEDSTLECISWLISTF